MFLPKTEADIIQAVQSEALDESPIFDAKEALSKNSEIAKDIAAMANDGGVIIYGLGENEHCRVTRLTPISFAGQAEKVDAIVRTSISEPPFIHITSIPTADDPSIGYLVVHVPPSERAPHMVVVKGDFRFYGRTATGNSPLSEGDVARLYARRQQIEVDREKLLETEINNSPIEPREEHAYLYIIARPVFAKEGFFDPLLDGGQNLRTHLNDLIQEVSSGSVYTRTIEPDFERPSLWRHTVDGFLGEMGSPIREGEIDPRSILQISVGFNGTGHLFCGGVGEVALNGTFLFYPRILAGLTLRFFTLLGKLYDRAKYYGMVDVGLAVKGLKGSVVYTNDLHLQYIRKPYDRNEYRKTGRFSALEMLENARGPSAYLVMPLVNAMSQSSLDPYQGN